MTELPIAGVQPFGLSDYPGLAAATVFFQGCNFRCPFCHNGQLTGAGPDAGLVPCEEIWDFLRKRRGLLGGVVVSGGEPTIHDQLPAFIAHVRELGLRVKLDTNGSRPHMLRKLLTEGSVDYVAMDVKAPLRQAHYEQLSGVAVCLGDIEESIGMLAESGVAHEFRTTYVPGLHSREDMARLRSSLPRGSLHRIQAFDPRHALDPTLGRDAADDSFLGVRQ